MARTVAIIGSAVAGPTLALHLLTHPTLRRAFRPVLFDKSPAPGDSPDMMRNWGATPTVDVSSKALLALGAMGLESALRTRGTQACDVSMWRANCTGSLEWLTTRGAGVSSMLLPNPGVVCVSRAALQGLLMERVIALGGEVYWSKAAVGFEPLERGSTRVVFTDSTAMDVDLVVGADGAFSRTRKFILAHGARDAASALDRSMPRFTGHMGIYGVSSGAPRAEPLAACVDASTSHVIFLDRGFIHTRQNAGVTTWDMVYPLSNPGAPPGTRRLRRRPRAGADNGDSAWQDAIVPGLYPHQLVVDVLQRHEAAAHPYAGTFGALLRSAQSITAIPLRQRSWRPREIHSNPPQVVLIGDAAQVLVPTCGQGASGAIEDATVLAQELLAHAGAVTGASARRWSLGTLVRAGQGADDASGIPSALKAYASERASRSRNMAALSTILMAIATGNNWLTRAVRDCGLKWAEFRPGKVLGLPSVADGWPSINRPKPLDHRFFLAASYLRTAEFDHSFFWRYSPSAWGGERSGRVLGLPCRRAGR